MAEVRKTPLPHTMGDAQPRPGISLTQETFSSRDQRVGGDLLEATAEPPEPRNCGQFSSAPDEARSTESRMSPVATAMLPARFNQLVSRFFVTTLSWLGSSTRMKYFPFCSSTLPVTRTFLRSYFFATSTWNLYIDFACTSAWKAVVMSGTKKRWIPAADLELE